MFRLLKNDADIKNPQISHLERMIGCDCQFLTLKTYYKFPYQFFRFVFFLIYIWYHAVLLSTLFYNLLCFLFF